MDAEARPLRARARQRSASGSVSRKLPPTIQNRSTSPSAACSIISAVVQPGAGRAREAPHLGPARRASPRRRVGTQPTSAPPCTPEWPRIGTRPRFGRPGSPRARPTLTSALIVSTPCACCVSPIDQTKTAFGRSISSRANACIRSRGAPLSRSSASQSAASARVARLLEARRCARARTPRRRRRASIERAKHADRGTRGRRRCARRTSGRRARCRRARSTAIDGTQ